ncbi:unnamed protein product [Rotaria magnacalcarata]|uniref:Uncharacterized protein n=1 Tax=Rotaria magnacalcarata TaxID=392030 RepID=A0A816YHY9_9BILA|nr:unnamed protein product [Rotaria magnacalcarata]
MEGQCLDAKLPDTANVVIQIEDTKVPERHATKPNGLEEKSIRNMGELDLQKNVRLGPTGLGLLTIVELRIIHVYEKLCVIVLSTDSGKFVAVIESCL